MNTMLRTLFTRARVFLSSTSQGAEDIDTGQLGDSYTELVIIIHYDRQITSFSTQGLVGIIYELTGDPEKPETMRQVFRNGLPVGTVTLNGGEIMRRGTIEEDGNRLILTPFEYRPRSQ